MAAAPAGTHDAISPAKRRWMVFVLFLTCVLNFADRAVFSALAQTIKADLRLSDFQLGLLQGLVFAALYAAVGLPIGLLAERMPRRRIIAVATAIWSAATAATGLAGSFVHLANYNPEYLPIFSRDVLHRIAARDESWETMVPAEVAELIKKRSFFGYARPAG
jgi:MFS family permease